MSCAHPLDPSGDGRGLLPGTESFLVQTEEDPLAPHLHRGEPLQRGVGERYFMGLGRRVGVGEPCERLESAHLAKLLHQHRTCDTERVEHARVAQRGLADELLVPRAFAFVVAGTESVVLLVAQGTVAVVEGGPVLAARILFSFRIEECHHLVERDRTFSVEEKLERARYLLAAVETSKPGPVLGERIGAAVAPRRDGERRLQHRLPHGRGTALERTRRHAAGMGGDGRTEPRAGATATKAQILERTLAERALHRDLGHPAGTGHEDRAE